MRDPVRLSEQAPSGFEASLVRAARGEAPSAAVRAATAAAGTLVIYSGFAGSIKAARGWLDVALGKASAKFILVIGASSFLTVALVVGVALRFLPFNAGRQTAAAGEPPVRTVSTALPDSSVMAPTVFELPRAPTLTQVDVSAPPKTKPPTAHIRTSNRRSADLAAEILAFEQARQAFARGDLATAGRRLEVYERNFPGGSLLPEAQVLRIEVLNAEGNQTEVRRQALAFLETHPRVPAARRIRTLLERAESASSK